MMFGVFIHPSSLYWSPRALVVHEAKNCVDRCHYAAGSLTGTYRDTARMTTGHGRWVMVSWLVTLFVGQVWLCSLSCSLGLQQNVFESLILLTMDGSRGCTPSNMDSVLGGRSLVIAAMTMDDKSIHTYAYSYSPIAIFDVGTFEYICLHLHTQHYLHLHSIGTWAPTGRPHWCWTVMILHGCLPNDFTDWQWSKTALVADAWYKMESDEQEWFIMDCQQWLTSRGTENHHECWGFSREWWLCAEVPTDWLSIYYHILSLLKLHRLDSTEFSCHWTFSFKMIDWSFSI